ncbi:MAG TPA: hypothetical protein VE422_43620 [Terriglobia bacterium]|nr:hypothetical protein [Terriglobia bacterium]
MMVESLPYLTRASANELNRAMEADKPLLTIQSQPTPGTIIPCGLPVEYHFPIPGLITRSTLAANPTLARIHVV